MCAFHVPYRPLVVLPSKHKNQTIDFQRIMALLLLPFPVPLAMTYYSNGHTAQGRHRTPYVRVCSTSLADLAKEEKVFVEMPLG